MIEITIRIESENTSLQAEGNLQKLIVEGILEAIGEMRRISGIGNFPKLLELKSIIKEA